MSTAIVSGLSHVGLAVSDLEASFGFFSALGYKKVGETPYPAYFLADDVGTVITLWQTTDSVAFNRKTNVGLHHLALKVPTEAALDEAYQTALKVPGVTNEFAPQVFGFGKHAMVFDPSGIRVEFAYHSG